MSAGWTHVGHPPSLPPRGSGQRALTDEFRKRDVMNRTLSQLLPDGISHCLSIPLDTVFCSQHPPCCSGQASPGHEWSATPCVSPSSIPQWERATTSCWDEAMSLITFSLFLFRVFPVPPGIHPEYPGLVLMACSLPASSTRNVQVVSARRNLGGPETTVSLSHSVPGALSCLLPGNPEYT